jgi:hypothetical protein
MKLRTLLFLLTLLSFLSLSVAREYIAIAPAIGKDVSRESSNSITHYFIRKYNKVAGTKAIEYQKFSAKLKENGFIWNTSFSDLSNALALARMLSVNYIILADFQKTECHITIFDLMQNTSIEKITKPYNGKAKDFFTENIPNIVNKMDPIVTEYIINLPEEPEPVVKKEEKEILPEEVVTEEQEESIAPSYDLVTEIDEPEEPEETKPEKAEKRERKPREKRERIEKAEKKVKEPREKKERDAPLFVKKIREKKKQDSLNSSQNSEITDDASLSDDETVETAPGEDLEKPKYLMERLGERLEERKEEKKAAKLEKKKEKMKEIEAKRKLEEAEMDAKIEKMRQKAKVTTVDQKAEAE